MAQARSGINALSDELLESIFSRLSATDLNTHCIRVSKRWNRILSDSVVFWQRYIRQYFDTSLNDCAVKDEPYLETYKSYFDPSPAMLKCRVAVPASFDVKLVLQHNPRSLAFALHVLTKMRKEMDQREIVIEDSSYSGHPTMCLFPWSQDVLPSAHRVFKIFNVADVEYITDVGGLSVDWQMSDSVCAYYFGFHDDPEWSDPEDDEGVTMYSDSSAEERDSSSDEVSGTTKQSKKSAQKISPTTEPKTREFSSERQRMIHLGQRPDGDLDPLHVEPCVDHGSSKKCEKCDDSFHLWVSRIFRPSINVGGGEETHSGGYNYTFLLTRLAPGFLGGVMSLVNISGHSFHCDVKSCKKSDETGSESD